MFDLHGLAEQANPEKTPMISKELAAFMQTWITGLGSVGRMYTNELRVYDEEGEWPIMFSTGWTSVIFGFIAYVVATAVWVLTTINLVDHAGDPWNTEPLSAEFQAAHPNYMNDELRSRDAGAIWVVCLVQVGYPIMAFSTVIYFNLCSKELDRTYPGWLSFMKDVVYAALDVTSKGGLALYVAMRATWVV